MELEFELTEKDYINFNIDHVKKSSSLKKNIMFQRIIGPILFLALPFTIRNYTNIPMWYWITIFGLFSVVWFAFYPKYFNWVMERRVKKMLKEGNNQTLFNKRKIKLTATGILEISPIGESHVNWNQINKIDETNNYIYIYISSISAHIIPKRIFKDKNEEKIFIKEILKYYKL